MLPFSTDAFSIFGRDGSLKGTFTRSGCSCENTAPAAKIKSSASCFILLSSIDDSYASVECVVLQLGPAVADAHSVEIVAVIDELTVPPLARRNNSRQSRNIVIRESLPVERLHPHIGVQRSSKRCFDAPVHGAERTGARRIPGEQYLDLAIHRVDQSRARDLRHFNAAVDVAYIEI